MISTSCFHIEFCDSNLINLAGGIPVKNEEGKAFAPYEFIITNLCDVGINYQVNLEILNDGTLTHLEYIRLKLNEKGKLNC